MCARTPSSIVNQVCLGVPHFRGQKFKGQIPPLNFYRLLWNWDKGTLRSSMAFGACALAEMKEEKLVENDFLVAASTFNFLNWFFLPAEVRVCRHKTNWFQILIPLTAEQSRVLPTIDLQSIQTQLMCWRRIGKRRRTPLSLLRFRSLLIFSFSASLTDDTYFSSAFGNTLIIQRRWMMLCIQHIFNHVCNYFPSSHLLLYMFSNLSF